MIKYLEKLLNGREVEWKKLRDISIIYGGLTGKNKYDFENGNLKYIPYKNIYNNLEINFDELELVKIEENEKQNFVKYGDVLFTGSSENLDEVGLSSVVTKELKENIYLNSFSFGLRFNENIKIIPKFSKFLFRCMKIRKEIKKASNGVTRFNLSKEKLNNILIPIPPLDVQEEIVKVLDKLTDHTKELTKELTLRKKEYSYYRDYLLEFNNIDDLGIEVKKVNLIDCCDIVMGVSPEGKTLSEIKLNNNIEFHQGKTYFTDLILGFSNIYTSSPLKYAEPNSIVMSVRAPVGDINIVDRNISIGRGLCMIKNKEEISNLKYIYHYIKNNIKELKSKSKGATFESITSEDIKNFKINLPSLEIQERIVNVLDNFEKICNDLNIGLPKEIELRTKQYEYYREQLLTFDK